MLLLHERLPFGAWLGGNLTKEESALAKAAGMPLLYSNGASKSEVERVVKSVIWHAIDSLGKTDLAKDPRLLTWEVAAPHLRELISAWRNQGQGLEPAQAAAAAPPTDPHDGGADEAEYEPTEEGSSSGKESTDSSSSSSSAADSESEADATAVSWAEFAHGSGKTDRIHFMLAGSLPPCARKVMVAPEGYGVGAEDARSRSRRVCSKCLKRFGCTEDDFLNRQFGGTQ